MLELDIDGDDAVDIVYPIWRRSDDARMLPLCRAGTWIELLGPDHAVVDEDLSLLISRLEAWRVLPSDHGSFGYVREPEWPEPAGDVLMLERIEKGAGIFYWKDGEFRARSLYRMVEP